MTSVRPRRWLAALFAKKTEQTAPSPYHAVAIRCVASACQAAQDSQRKRYISADAPRLPLEKCDHPDQCECRYQHYDDRRSGPRRDEEDSPPTRDPAERVERRQMKGRREGDITDDAEPFLSLSKNSYYEHIEDTVRTPILGANDSHGVDPYNSGSFDRSASLKSNSSE